ncbi:MAG: hypothetical protein V1859_06700 [archaeon]
MSFESEISVKLRAKLDKLAFRDRNLADAVSKKIRQIIACDAVAINHFKNLKGDMSHLKRVHIGSHVLTFQVKGDTIIFEDFTHHDDAY